MPKYQSQGKLYMYTLRALSTFNKAILIANEVLDSPVVGAKVDMVWSALFVFLPVLLNTGSRGARSLQTLKSAL
jgi:hypothetical protein